MSRDSLKSLAESHIAAPRSLGVLALICIVLGLILGVVLS
jgi:hypothetical protein